MTESEDVTGPAREVDPERVALVWMDAVQAFIVRWRDEPVIERVESGVPPKRSAVGSVRRGPARPFGGGRVPGHGTEGRHLEEVDRYLGDLASRLTELQVIEVSGRGLLHQRLATTLRDLAERRGDEIAVTTTTTSRRPSERQLLARLRKMVDRELPRRSPGRYRRGVQGPATATGRPTPSAQGRRTLRPPHLPEHQEIEHEVEAMLADDGRTMTAESDQGRRPPRDRFAGTEHVFDPRAIAIGLRSEDHPARDGHRQMTIFHKDSLTLIVFDFEAGGRLPDHRADADVTIMTLSGRLEVATPTETHQLTEGALLVLDPGVPHDVHAPVASQMLLAVNRT